MCKNICCNIYFDAALMGERNALFDLFVRKILRLCPQTKRLAAQIDRIGSVKDRRLEDVQAARRVKSSSFLMFFLSFIALHLTPRHPRSE